MSTGYYSIHFLSTSRLTYIHTWPLEKKVFKKKKSNIIWFMIPIKNHGHLWCKRIASSNILLLSFSEILVVWLYMTVSFNISFTRLQNQVQVFARRLLSLKMGSLSYHPCCDTGPRFHGLIRWTAPVWSPNIARQIKVPTKNRHSNPGPRQYIFVKFKNDKYFSQFAIQSLNI